MMQKRCSNQLSVTSALSDTALVGARSDFVDRLKCLKDSPGVSDTISNLWSYLIDGKSTGEVLFLLAASLMAGLARGFAGFGAALIFMPTVSSVVGPQAAAAILLIIDSIAALGMIPDSWRRSDHRAVGTMAIGSLIGIPLGTALLAFLDPHIVRWVIVTVVACLFGLLVSGWRFRGQSTTGTIVGVGLLTGFCTGTSQIGGPPLLAYWLGTDVSGVKLRANVVLYFAISTVISLVTYSVGGLITWRVFGLSIVVGPVYALGLFTGTRAFGLASETVFRRACYSLIILSVILGLPLLDPILHRH